MRGTWHGLIGVLNTVQGEVRRCRGEVGAAVAEPEDVPVRAVCDLLAR